MTPSGPESPLVYWIRRGAVLLVFITALALVWWLFGALRGGDGDSTPTSAESASPSASATAEASATASPTASSAPAEPTDCSNAAITVDAAADAKTFTVGESPKLTVTITNAGDVACLRDVGPKANELEITSGGYHVWSSDDCNASNKSKVVTLKPGETYAASITWNGRISQKGCPDDGEGAEAKAGRYEVVGRNGKVTSDGTPFALKNPASE